MTFRSPGVLLWLLIVPVVLGGYIWGWRRRMRRTAAFGAPGPPATGPARRPPGRHVAFAAFLAALTLLLLASSRPMTTTTTPRSQATVILALDVSNSMAATDSRPSRLAAAQAAATTLVRRQPPAVRIGVVAFASGAVIVQRPTRSRPDALRAINRLSLGGGTSIASGILTSLDAIAGRTLHFDGAAGASDKAHLAVGYYSAATIILLSDGEDTGRTGPLAAARLASVAGVRVETVGIGTPAGTTVDIAGFRIATSLHSATLRALAAATNGSYHAGTGPAALDAVGATIRPRWTMATSRAEITALFAAAALVVLGAAAVLSLQRFGRVV